VKLKTDKPLKRYDRVTAADNGTVTVTFDPAKAIGTVVEDSGDGWVTVDLDFNGVAYIFGDSKFKINGEGKATKLKVK
jgi:hypothetical protein